MLLVLGSVLGSLLVFAPPAGAHDVAHCEPPFVYPSFAIWAVPAGGTSSFYLPPRYFGSLVATTPVDLAMFRYSTCEPDPSCHHHGIVGPFLCGSTPASILELHNPGDAAAIVELAIGMCFDAAVCDEL